MAARFFDMTSSRQHDFELHSPALCEELRIRDILDNVAEMTSGAFAAAYELSGVHSYYHTEEMRNRAKESLEAVLRSMPERSMRFHLRFEIRQDTGDVIRRYSDCTRNSNTVLASIDEERCSRWSEKETAGEFLDYRLYAMFYWDINPSLAMNGKRGCAEPGVFPRESAYSEPAASTIGSWPNLHLSWSGLKQRWP